jgi:mannan endo-1,4-beta-mannosidase
VIPVLGNHHADCDYYPSYAIDSGFTKDTAWYASGYKRPYSGYPMSYRDYVASVVREFKDDPAILMWQLVNEAQTSTLSDGPQLRAFATDVAGLVKSIDANHLVSFGTQGTGQPGTAGPDYRALHEIPSIDVVEAHDYGEEAESLPGFPDCRWNCIWASLVEARGLGKPFFIGEAGMQAGDEGACALSREQRADLLGAKVSALFREGGVGYLFWDYSEGTAGNPCDYALGPGDPAMRRMRSLAQAMADRGPP